MITFLNKKNIVGIMFKRIDENYAHEVKIRNKLLDFVNSREKLGIFIDYLPDLVWVKDYEFRYVDVNKSFLRFVGKDVEEVIGKTDSDIFSKDFADHTFKVDREIKERKQIYEFSTEYNDRIIKIREIPIYNENVDLFWILGIAQDVTKQERMEQELEEKERLYELITESASDYIFQIDLDGNFVFKNHALMQVIGRVRNISEVIDDENTKHNLFEVLEERKKGFKEQRSYEFLMKVKKGTIFVHLKTSPLVVNGKIVGVVGIARDISERKKYELKLKNMAFIDSLTGCYGRNYLKVILNREENLAKRNGTKLGVIMIDVNDFKSINDNFGHQVGDDILRMVGKVLRSSVREYDYVIRYGGDEFLIILHGVFGKIDYLLFNRINEKLSRELNGNILPITTLSFGYAIYDPKKNDDFDEVIKEADSNMYDMKKEHHKGTNSLR